MWQGLGRLAGFALILALPGCIIVAALYATGFLGSTVAIVAAAAVLGSAILIVLPFVLSLPAARAAIEGLGPDGAPAETPPLVIRGIWSPMLRLRRAWREHAARAEGRRTAAEAVIAAVPDPLILIDAQRRIVGTNAAAATFIGRSVEPRDLAGALRNPILLTAIEAILRGEPGHSVEFTLSVPVERVWRANVGRIDGAGLDGAAVVLTLHDVTELKRTEQMRADFVANAGHELKTPLATLIGFIETLLGPARDDAAARERFLGIMHEQARRMSRLVDDLLSLSRIELNEHVVPTGHVALGPVIDEVARGLELRAAARGVRIRCTLPPDFPDVQGERDELAQIFQNLLDNAVKYCRPDTEVSVTGGNGSGVDGALVWVSVADRSEGITATHLPRLTERFYRVDAARSREIGGTGLGLAIVKHILNRHRGRLDIASRLGEGSTFTVRLRVADPSSGQHADDG